MKDKEIQQLIDISKKPLSGFELKSESNKLIVKVKPKTILFGCLTILFIAISIIMFFVINDSTLKYIFAIAPIAIGFISLVSLSKNATQTTFDFSVKTVSVENSNFIGKIFNKSKKYKFDDITDVVVREEMIRNNNSAGGTSSRNFVYKIYLTLKDVEIQIITVGVGVLTKEDLTKFTSTLKQIIT